MVRRRKYTPEEKLVLNRIDDVVQRTKEKTLSKQPRFDPKKFFASVFGWVQSAAQNEPEYSSDSRTRDKWLRSFWPLEPHLAGVLNGAVGIDKNRGWSLTGGRNQVYRYTDILHEYENGLGWRYGCGQAALSFYTADMNAVVELGRDGAGGPLRALYHVDPARCKLTGNPDTPLEYYPAQGVMQKWQAGDYFRVAAMPSTDEAMRGLGYCAVSRCLELAKIMVAVYQHDQEALGAKAPRGLLLLRGIEQAQWEQVMKSRAENLTAKEREYYGGVEVLASMDDISATLVALSQLPAGFDIKVFTDLLMYGYALCFGYDPSEFWPVQFGALGRGTEAETQARKASGKGGKDFILGYQERLQRELPDALLFEFDERDIEGELVEAAVAKAKAEVAQILYEAGAMAGAPLLDREEARSLLAESGVIPREWTETEEDTETTDVDDTRERALARPQIRRAIEEFPDEQIVCYRWPAHATTVLWPRKPRRRGRRIFVKRQDDSAVLYRGDDFTITEADVDSAVANAARRTGAEFAAVLEAPPLPEGEA